MLQERLRYQRVPVEVPVECSYQSDAGPRKVRGKCVNLSTSGMRVQLQPSPPTGSVIHLRFCLPEDSEVLVLDAVVVGNYDMNHIGVRLINLTRDDRWRLINFSKSRFA